METLLVTNIRTKEYAKDKKGALVLDENGQPELTDKDLTDKNGKKFKVLEFGTPDTTFKQNSKGQMVALARPQVYVGGYAVWEISNLQSNKGKADFGYNLELGQEIQGTIVKRKVEPYTVNGKTVEVASVVTFADSDDKDAMELDIQAQFKRKNHKLVGAVPSVHGAINDESAPDGSTEKVVDRQTKKAK